jgi:hypothetical protein
MCVGEILVCSTRVKGLVEAALLKLLDLPDADGEATSGY